MGIRPVDVRHSSLQLGLVASGLEQSYTHCNASDVRPRVAVFQIFDGTDARSFPYKVMLTKGLGGFLVEAALILPVRFPIVMGCPFASRGKTFTPHLTKS